MCLRLQEQALACEIEDIDAVLITHEHFDHVGGIDDLRPFCAMRPLALYVRQDVDSHLRKDSTTASARSLIPVFPFPT